MRVFFTFCWLVALLVVPAAGADVDYRSKIKPLLAEKCYSCHGRLKQESDLRLETRSLMVDSDVIVSTLR